MTTDPSLRPDGYLGTEQGVDRLLSDLRVMSGAGIERAAWGWDRHEDPRALARFREAERAAMQVLEAAELGEKWDELKNEILTLTEGRGSLVAWAAEHGMQAIGPSRRRGSCPMCPRSLLPKRPHLDRIEIQLDVDEHQLGGDIGRQRSSRGRLLWRGRLGLQ
ncbi:MAG: hypothetical protein ABI978_03125 [Chloroflexota bacterium]